jgi:putative membrane protein
MKIIYHWIIAAVAIGIAAYLIPGVTVTVLGALVLAIVLGIINVFIKPVISILTLPITILTLGIFSLVVNALFVLLAALIVPGFAVASFWSALLFAIVLSFVNAFFHLIDRRSRA